MTFFNKKVGLAVSDPPDGLKFRIIKTTDGGRTWSVVDPAGMPPALPGEFAFAASGQCITSNHGRSAWLGSGGSAQARVFTSRNRGRTWTVSPTPLNSGPTTGINALAFRSQQHGLAVGGDFALPANSPNNFAATRNGGGSWSLLTGAPAEYRSGVTWVNGNTAIAVGLTGSDVTRNKGRTWTASTTAASTRLTARTRTPAGPPARTAASPTSPANQPDGFDLDELAFIAERRDAQ